MIFPEERVYAKKETQGGFDIKADRLALRLTGEAADETESLKNFIEKTVKTRSGRYAAYENGFGIKVGHSPNAAELQAAIKEALLSDERILAVEISGMRRDGDDVYMRLEIKSIYGNIGVGTVAEVN